MYPHEARGCTAARALFALALLVLGMILAGCGGGKGGTVSLTPDQPQTGTDEVALPITPGGTADPLAVSDLGASGGLGYDPGDREARIERLFSNPEGAGGRRTADTLIVYFHPELSLSAVNAGREQSAGESRSVAAPDASAPLIDPGLGGAGPAISQTQPNDVLVENFDYLALARFLADGYDLEIRTELYYGASNWALCKVSSGTDEGALARRILRENRDIVKDVRPELKMKLCSFTPRSGDERIDDIEEIGYGIVPDPFPAAQPNLNHHDFWNYGESYHYFQTNTHMAHASRFGIEWCVDLLDKPGFTARAFGVDSGVYPDHNEFGNYQLTKIPGWDVTTEGWKDFDDHHGHGTMSAGILIADSGNGGIAGYLPGGDLMPIKASTDVDPEGTDAYVQLAILLAFAMRETYDCYVVNVPYTCPCIRNPGVGEGLVADGPEEPWGFMIETIKADPRFVVVAGAGNGDPDTHFAAPVIKAAYDPEAGEEEYGDFVYWDAFLPAAVTYWDNIGADIGAEGYNWPPVGHPDSYHHVWDYNDQVFSVMAATKDDDWRGDTNFPLDHLYGEGDFPFEWQYLWDIYYYRRLTTKYSVQFMQPGVSSLTTSRDGPNAYTNYGGTSLATTCMTGLVSLLQAYTYHDPIWDANRIKSHLEYSRRRAKWDGDGWEDYEKPFPDNGRALTWIDIKSPSSDPEAHGFPPVLIAQPMTHLELVARAHFPESYFITDVAHESDVRFILSTADDSVREEFLPYTYGARDDDFYNPNLEDWEKLTLTTFTANAPWEQLSEFEGLCKLVAVLDPNNGNPESMSQVQWLYIEQEEGASWPKTELHDLVGGLVDRLAIGHDQEERVHVGWGDFWIPNPEYAYLRTAVEQAPGAQSFDQYHIQLIDRLAMEEATDLTVDIDHRIYDQDCGVFYQLYDDYDDDQVNEWRTAFSYVDGGQVNYRYDDNSEPYQNGSPLSSFRENTLNAWSTLWVDTHYGGYSDYRYATRDTLGVWTDALLAAAPPLAINWRITMLPKDGYRSPPPRCVIERSTNDVPDYYYQVYHGIIGAGPSLTETLVPKLDMAMDYQTWLGTAFRYGVSGPDHFWSPVVFTRVRDDLMPTVSHVEAALPYWEGFLASPVEACSDGPFDQPYYHGAWGDARFCSARQLAILAYYSGHQSQNATGGIDRGDLKVAYVPYVNGEWGLAYVVTVDPLAAADEIVMDIVDDRVVIAYTHWAGGPGAWQRALTVAYEAPDFDN